MGLFEAAKYEVFAYFADEKRKSIAFISGLPFEDTIREWLSFHGTEKNPVIKIAIVTPKDKEYTVYENGTFIRCIDDSCLGMEFTVSDDEPMPQE